MKPFLCALSFLTIIPIPKKISFNDKDYANATIFFPAVGLGIGLCLLLVVWSVLGLDKLRNQQIPGYYFYLWLILLGGEALLTGLLHWDGFSDSMDGFLSGKKREDVLKIMEDSRAGAKGVFMTLLAFAFLGLLWFRGTNLHIAIALPVRGGGATGCVPILLPSASDLVVVFLFSRMAMACGLAFFPYVRLGGLGEKFSKCGHKRGWVAVLLAFLFLIFCSRSLAPLLAFFFVVVVILVWGWYCKKRIGGMTGDTLGALCIMSEIAALVALLFFHRL